MIQNDSEVGASSNSRIRCRTDEVGKWNAPVTGTPEAHYYWPNQWRLERIRSQRIHKDQPSVGRAIWGTGRRSAVGPTDISKGAPFTRTIGKRIEEMWETLYTKRYERGACGTQTDSMGVDQGSNHTYQVRSRCGEKGHRRCVL